MVLIRLMFVGVLASMVLLAQGSTDQRRADLIAEITALGQKGLQVHRVSETPQMSRYTLKVVDERNATANLLAGWGDGLIDPQMRAEVAEWLRGGELSVTIDWGRYLSGQPRSVRVTFLGNASTRMYPEFQQWLKGEHLGAWLSFGKDDRLTQATLIPIDAAFHEDKVITHWQVKGYDLNITRSNPTNRYDLATILHGGLFTVEQSESGRVTQSARLDRIDCQSDTKGRYDGKVSCRIPHLVMHDTINQLEVNGVTIHQTSHESNGTISGRNSGQIDRLDLTYRDGAETGTLHVDGVTGMLDVTMGETIAYHTQTQLERLEVNAKRKGVETLQLKLNGLKEDITVTDLYNFMPALTRLAEGKTPDGFGGNTPHDEQWYYEAIANRIVQHGATATIDPLAIGDLSVRGEGIPPQTFAPMRLTLQSRLDRNTIDMRRSSAPILMLGYLHLDGKWVLAKKDFETIQSMLPLKIKMLTMLFVKYENDRAIFDLKFDKGHLRINGRQVM